MGTQKAVEVYLHSFLTFGLYAVSGQIRPPTAVNPETELPVPVE